MKETGVKTCDILVNARRSSPALASFRIVSSHNRGFASMAWRARSRTDRARVNEPACCETWEKEKHDKKY
jgi:hypothetical protein